jgi:hypothetical protein
VGSRMDPTPKVLSIREGLVAQCSRVVEDSDYSSQCHFNTGATFKLLHYVFGSGSAVLGGVAAGALIVPSFVPRELGAVAAVAAAVLAGLVTTLSPSEASANHFKAGNEYLRLRKECQAFLDLDLSNTGLSEDELGAEVRELIRRGTDLDRAYGDLYTPRWAYSRAREDIRLGRTRHRIDATRDSG